MKAITKSALVLAGVVSASASWAVGTPAGTNIVNTATATFDSPNGETGITVSDSAELTVLELISVDVTATTTTVTTDAGDTDQVLEYTVTNTGNGSETFTVDATNLAGDDFDVTDIQVYLDNGDGVFGPEDTLLPAGSPITLDANNDADATIFVVADVPNDGQVTGENADVEIDIASTTPVATDSAPGTLLEGEGTGVSDAVVGSSSSDTATATYEIGEAPVEAIVDIVKTIISRQDPFGGNSDVPGTIVTYQIAVNVSGGDVNNLIVTDSLPASTDYIANSITLNSAAKTDVSGDDEVNVSGNNIEVILGNAADTSSFVIQLQAEIK